MQSSVARRRCAERSELLHSFRCILWWLCGLVAVPSVVLFGKETKGEIRESTETVGNFRGEPVCDVGTCLPECLFQRSFQRPNDLCVIIVVSRLTEANNRQRHRL